MHNMYRHLEENRHISQTGVETADTFGNVCVFIVMGFRIIGI